MGNSYADCNDEDSQNSDSVSVPPTYCDLQARARECLKDELLDFVHGGAGRELTVEKNETDFRQWEILPKVFEDVSERSLALDIFGSRYDAPLSLAPIGALSHIHEDGPVETANAAGDVNVPFVFGMTDAVSLERVAEEMGAEPFWFQLYWGKDREVIASIIRRVERAGFRALVVTMDAPVRGWRPRDIEPGNDSWFTWERVRETVNYLEDPVFQDRFEGPPEANKDIITEHFRTNFVDPSLTWEDIDFLRETTSLPIIIKGIIRPDDARRALEHGVDGIVVSNHGGRQIDGALSSIEALPPVVREIDGAIPVLLDGGVRGGADIFKALALGADMVSIGRPYLLALAIGGRDGVAQLFHHYIDELDTILGLTGNRSLSEVARSDIRRRICCRGAQPDESETGSR